MGQVLGTLEKYSPKAADQWYMEKKRLRNATQGLG